MHKDKRSVVKGSVSLGVLLQMGKANVGDGINFIQNKLEAV